MRINDYYTEIALRNRSQKIVVAMDKVQLDNLVISAALREGTSQSPEEPQNKTTATNETTTNRPKMRRIYRRSMSAH